MQTKEVVVENPHGLHLRVAAKIVSLVQQHKAKVKLSCQGCPDADGCSILQLVLLDAGYGTTVNVQVDGPDEQILTQQLCQVFRDGGGI